MRAKSLESPYPWYGGKRRVAELVWRRLGNWPHYVEPFFGSGAVLLGRPVQHRRADLGWPTETVNDLDGFVSNAWRAMQRDPAGCTEWADQPVHETDLHARHLYLRERRQDLTARLMADPEYFDVRIAGWWLWGQSIWCCGCGWCGVDGIGPWGVVDGKFVKVGPSKGVVRARPHLGGAGEGVASRRPVGPWFAALAERMRRVRVLNGDWGRALEQSATVNVGPSAIFLDPPYTTEADRHLGCYAVEDGAIAHQVREWCAENGTDARYRIALCGYEGEHDVLEALGWDVVVWKTGGGYANQGTNTQGLINAKRERIWFSPACLPAELAQGVLFD